MKAIALARVSTEEQKDAGNSLPAQIARIEAYCKRKDFKIVETFSFDESAYKNKRDEFDKIIQYLKNNKEKIAVCFDKVDRLSRNVFDKRVSALYEKAVSDEIELHFVSDGQVINNSMSAVEKFQFGMSLGLAKYYSDAISDNVKRAYEQKKKNGEWIGKAHIGYKNITLENGKKDVVPDEDRAFLVKRIFELYATGKYSMKGLAILMEEEGLTNHRTGKVVSASQIEHILKNPFYHGVMRIQGVKYPHKYEPLISYQLFQKVRDVINGYNRNNFKRTNKPYVFRGLIRCAGCGCTITPELKKNKYVYYHCTNYHRNCPYAKIWLREEELLEPIIELLKSLSLSKETAEKLKDELRNIHERDRLYCEQNRTALEKKLRAVQEKMKVMYDDRLTGRITVEMYDEMLDNYKQEEQDLRSKLNKDNEIRSDEIFFITAEKLLDLASNAYQIFKSSEPEEKTQLLNFLLQNFSLEAKNLSFKTKSPFEGLLVFNKSNEWLRD